MDTGSWEMSVNPTCEYGGCRSVLRQIAEAIFGGVDRWQYIGDLEPVPLDPQPVEGVAGREIWTGDDVQENALIDMGSPYSYLNEKHVAIIGKEFNAWIDDQGVSIVDCALGNGSLDTIDFYFNNGNLGIPLTTRDFNLPQGRRCHLGV
ncbi:hypothetical protein MKZ38_006320 [Zalerion maritima]|uniref:Peptidase A1 domain-containing protein n=1 Tax=Zalerion maritima TaxID=339359 RepID=A0AAD5RJY9_9PEZI|nr:hypothetical protein MKZ38_006320 [Zalerion maritima]